MIDLIFTSATKIAQAIRAKEVSSEEITQACLDRIATVNPHLNAVVQLSETAMTEAKAADEVLAKGEVTSPLHGVPMTLKDSIDTAGIITTAGTLGRKNFVPQKDATVATRLKKAGAILLGKTNTPELTLYGETLNLVYGQTNNPYNLERIPGGSSGGAASIVASGGSFLDLGTDTGGSIRQPAHFCGVAGLKPTSGRVPRTGHIVSYEMGALDSLTTIGPLTRSVEDLGLIFDLIAGPDWRDPAIVPMPIGNPAEVDLKTLRAAYYLDNGIVSPTDDVADVVKNAIAALSDTGMSLEENRPEEVASTGSLWLRVATADGSAWARRILQQAGTTETHPVLDRFLSAEAIPSGDMTALLEEVDRVRSNMLRFLKNYDLIVCPVNAFPAMPHGQVSAQGDGYSYTRIYNITGWPVAVVRGGESSDGLPIGVQIIGRPWREDVVLAAAQHLETTLGGWQKPSL